MNISKKTIKLIYIGLIILFCSLLITLFLINKTENESSNHINVLRLDSNPIYEFISNRWPLAQADVYIIKEMSEDYKIDITIVRLDEKIVYSNSKTLDLTGERILLDALYMDRSYTVENPDLYKISQPIYFDGQVDAFAIFEKSYNQAGEKNSLYKKIIILLLFAVVLSFITLAGFMLFKKKKNELKTLEEGLVDISKGILRPITIQNDKDFGQIYNTYNALVEELSYIMKQQQSYEGQRKDFLTMISHELKTPISTINAYVEGLASGVANDEETKEKYLAIISDKIKQLTKQVEDFFKYAQDEANRFKYNFEECYADEVIGKIFSSLAGGQRPGISIQNLLPKCIFSIDKIRLEQVIMNLYNNALKHTAKEDAIILKAYREDSDVVIEIEDRGEGISPKDLPYIFDYYYQGETSKKSDYEGIGLGLAICKNIVDSHKGSIKVKSKVGQGTTMYIKIPLV